jgi:hypothetical protein
MQKARKTGRHRERRQESLEEGRQEWEMQKARKTGRHRGEEIGDTRRWWGGKINSIFSYQIGNSYPVIENPQMANSLSGATLKAGYQSHYVLTSKTGMPREDHEKYIYDEIVVNQETQVIEVEERKRGK